MQPLPSPQLPPDTAEFIQKIYRMIQENEEIICFSGDGSEVQIKHYAEFVDRVLPAYFRHRQWKSFIRQMNMYKFRKVNRDNQTYIFVHKVFRRGNEASFGKIRRKANVKDDEQSNELHETDVKKVLRAQCQLLGITNNIALLFRETPFMRLPSNPTLKRAHNPSSAFKASSNSSLGSQSAYTNSMIEFINYTMDLRKETDKTMEDIRHSLELLGKERKSMPDNKPILGTMRDCFQMVEEVSAKMRDRMADVLRDEEIRPQPSQIYSKEKKTMESCFNIEALPIKSAPLPLLNPFPSYVPASLMPASLLVIPQPIAHSPEPLPPTYTSLKCTSTPALAPSKLGVSSLCSFSSVTNLMNLDKVE